MKKRITLALLSIATFLFAFHSASALTEYKYEGWTSGNGYGTAIKVDDNITNLKGNATATGGMYVGPFSKASTAKLEDGITEEVYIGIDPEEIANGEFFEVSLALRNGANEYVSEAVVMTQRVGDEFKVTAGWADDFEAVVTSKGIYTYKWEMFVEEGKTYVNFTLLQGNREIASTDEVDFDTIVTSDTKNPIVDEEDVSVKYLWFCNVNVAKGVNVYTKLPVVNLTFVDVNGEEEAEVLEVFKYMSFTEEEEEKFVEEFEKLAEENGYTFEGFYADEEFENEFDFTKSFEDDRTVYIKMTKIEEEEDIPADKEETSKNEELPPKTGDINLVLLIGTIILGIAGLVVVSKKRFAKNN